ncbi:hypothetical protein VCHE16_2110, partial [Vibrio paracholerae HE-16]|jgi:hypothetical protein
MHV